ncbi:hypothetical protein ACFE04_001029 [Oxalis oulophora]
METEIETELKRSVLDTLKNCQQRQDSVLVWSLEVGKCLASRAISLPSPELGQLLVSHLCFQNNHPSLWKFLELSLSSSSPSSLLSPLHVLSLLTSRIIINRRSQPLAYRLYLELLSRYALDFRTPNALKILNSIDAALNLSTTYGFELREIGHAMVLVFFTIVIRLIDATMEDWGLRLTLSDAQLCGVGIGGGGGGVVDMEVDVPYNTTVVGNHEHHERVRRKNTFIGMEVLAKLTESKRALALLHLVHLNMPEKFKGLLLRLQFLEANKLVSPDLKSANQLLARLSSNIQGALGFQYRLNNRNLTGTLLGIGSHRPLCNLASQPSQSSCWVLLDIFMENSIDGRQLPVASSILILSETINTLRVFNRASWQDTFLALWLSALRLERDPLEGPIPHLEARLCVLFSVVPLAIANIIEDEARSSSSSSSLNMETVKGGDNFSRKRGLISSLQVLENYSGLLCPPSSVLGAANIAAAKAASFISSSRNATDSISANGSGDSSLNAGGNLRHLIVEACLARNLIDTSAYFWPGYVSASLVSQSDILPVQKSPWSTFMEGAPLNGPLVNLLSITPATSLAEIEKVYHIAISGSAEERSSAAKILCGASLISGWNIQEHVVRFVIKLLSPPIPTASTETRGHLVDHMPALSSTLVGASSVESVHILSLYGAIPEVAAALMPLCERFGSLMPTSINISSSDDEPTTYMIFSAAFLFLLRLWKFYRPPLEMAVSGGENMVELSLEYLLLLRSNFNSAAPDQTSNQQSGKPVYVDDYPKLRDWCSQNNSCLASTLSGLSNGNPVHQVANKILSMIYCKMNKSGPSVVGNPSTSSNSNSTSSAGEETNQRPLYPAWEVLEAIPFVLEAILTACAYGRLSSRDLTTGLRDLVDFLPASVAAIVSYFSAEVTRGIWKPVPMNGTDWPSPAASLPSVESEMRQILTAVGVDVPFSATGSAMMLPLPMAALVSLTITFKVQKSLQHIHAVVGPALENCASACPWPSVPIIGSLWAQKVRRWHEFIVVTCCRAVFRQNKVAVTQLLRSCFTSFLGSLQVSNSWLTKESNINGLLGSTISSRGPGPTIAPGLLYLRSCRSIQSIHYLNELIVRLVVDYSHESATRWASKESLRLKSSQASLSLAIAKAREVATLGASLLCITGGLQLAQELYRETVPTCLLSSRDEKCEVSTVARIMEGYTLAYMLVITGGIIWGVEDNPPSWSITKSRRARIVGTHMDFLARVMEDNITLGCHPTTWKAYVSCFLGLVVSGAPGWIQEMKVETLKKLATGLVGWHECEIALSLLERGGVACMGSVAELLGVIK